MHTVVSLSMCYQRHVRLNSDACGHSAAVACWFFKGLHCGCMPSPSSPIVSVDAEHSSLACAHPSSTAS